MPSFQTHIQEDAAPPEDIAIAHMERYLIPGENRWSAPPPSRKTMQSPKTMQYRLTHTRYSCVTKRYPYFFPGLLDADAEVKEKLTHIHELHLSDHLAIDFLNH